MVVSREKGRWAIWESTGSYMFSWGRVGGHNGNGMDGWGRPMRPTAREMNQHGGPPGWLEENDPVRFVL